MDSPVVALSGQLATVYQETRRVGPLWLDATVGASYVYTGFSEGSQTSMVEHVGDAPVQQHHMRQCCRMWHAARCTVHVGCAGFATGVRCRRSQHGVTRATPAQRESPSRYQSSAGTRDMAHLYVMSDAPE